MNEKQVMALLDACYHEFCDIVGDSPCGCECCPYFEYTTDENEDGCYEAYQRDKLSATERTD